MNFPRTQLISLLKPATTLAAALSIISCSPTGNPHLDMCMKLAGNMLPGEATFGEITEVKGRTEMKMTLPYTSDGVSGEAICVFAKEDLEKDTTNEAYRTSPKTMTMNGVELAGKDLMKASLASSKEVIKDTADETKKQAAAAAEEAKVMAADAKDKATEMAADAKVKAGELADEAKVKADEMATKIKDSEVVDRAKSAIVDGAKKVQESLDN